VKIAVWHNLPSGGGKRALYDHVRGLVARGHSVEAWCPPTADRDYLPLSDIIIEHVVPLPWREKTPAPMLKRLHPRRWNVGVQLRAMEEHCRRCAEQINSGGFDVLFANSCQFFRTSPIARFVRLPGLLYLQEPYRWLYEALPRLPLAALPPAASPLSAGELRRILKDQLKLHMARVQAREELRNAQSFDTILVNSLYSRESLLRAYGVSAKICYLGVDSERCVDYGWPREAMAVGIGAVIPEKNIELAIEALGRVAHKRPRLVWIGNVAERTYLEQLRELARRRNVEFVPRIGVSDDEIIETLNRASLMLYAPRLEPFGYAPLEANACGVPVVAVAEGGVRETVQHNVNGLLVEHDADAMAQAVARLIDDRELARRLGNNGRQLVVEQWSLDAAVERLEHRIRELLAQPQEELVSA